MALNRAQAFAGSKILRMPLQLQQRPGSQLHRFAQRALGPRVLGSHRRLQTLRVPEPRIRGSRVPVCKNGLEWNLATGPVCMNCPHEADVAGKPAARLFFAQVSQRNKSETPQAQLGLARHSPLSTRHSDRLPSSEPTKARLSASRQCLGVSTPCPRPPSLVPTEARAPQGSSAHCSGPRRPAKTRRISDTSSVVLSSPAVLAFALLGRTSECRILENIANARGCGFPARISCLGTAVAWHVRKLLGSICACGSVSETVPTAPATATTATLRR